MAPDLERFLAALRSADRTRAARVVRQALDRGVPAGQLIEDLVTAGLNALGQGWEDGAVSLTQVYIAGRIAEDLLDTLLPQVDEPATPWGTVVIGTIGEHHGLGQRIVATHLNAAGARVVPIGLGLAPADFVQRAVEERADLIAISALTYRSAVRVREVRDLVARDCPWIPIIVGGAPFNLDRELYLAVGADAMGSNPAEGVAVARRLISNGFQNDRDAVREGRGGALPR